MHWCGNGFALCEAEHLCRAIAGCRYDTQGGAGYLSCGRLGNGADGGGEDFGGSHVGGVLGGKVFALPCIRSSAGGTYRLLLASYCCLVVQSWEPM